jgi:hypothetical protein
MDMPRRAGEEPSNKGEDDNLFVINSEEELRRQDQQWSCLFLLKVIRSQRLPQTHQSDRNASQHLFRQVG